MTLKINPWLATLVMAGILVLLFALFRGCKNNRQLVVDNTALTSANKQLKSTIDSSQKWHDSTDQDYRMKLELSEGQGALWKEQSIRSGNELQTALDQNKQLVAKHKLAEYADTTATIVPRDYIVECEDCFTKLDNTTNLANRYKNDLNNLQDNWDKQNQIYQKRFKSLDSERLGFYNKINALSKQSQDAANKLKPHGRLYLSWGVMWGYWPKMAGAGLLYQTKSNMLYGAKWYYGSQGHMIETTLNFPLSIKF